jgi:capsular polysaccharide biosynthesis protein
MKAYLEDASKESELIPVNTGLQDSYINEQIAQYNVMKLRRDKLIEEGSAQNPVVLDVNTTLKSIKQSIIRSVDNVVVGFETRLNEAKSQEGYALARMFSMPQKERELLSIERQQQIKEALYVFLLNKREENALTQAMVDNNAQIINDVAGSDRPIAPNRTKVLLLGFLLGLAIPGVWFLAKLFLDTRVQNRRDIKDNVTVPFLGEIPLDKEHQKKKVKSAIVVDAGNRHSSYRHHRTIRLGITIAILLAITCRHSKGLLDLHRRGGGNVDILARNNAVFPDFDG